MHEAAFIRRAADRLACTQAALSIGLKLLTVEIGVPAPQGPATAPRGVALYAKAPRALATDGKRPPPRSRPAPERIRLGLPDDQAPGWLALAEFNLHPAEVDVTCDLSADRMEGVQRQNPDPALVTVDSRLSQTQAMADMPPVPVYLVTTTGLHPASLHPATLRPATLRPASPHSASPRRAVRRLHGALPACLADWARP